MRVRSEWLTLFTVTALAAGALVLRGGGSPEPAAAPAPRHPDVAASGIDFTPVGTTHPLTDSHPAAKTVKPRAKPAAPRP